MKFSIFSLLLMLAGMAQAQKIKQPCSMPSVSIPPEWKLPSHASRQRVWWAKVERKGNPFSLQTTWWNGNLKKSNIKEGNNGSYKQNISAFMKSKANKRFMLADFNYSDNYRLWQQRISRFSNSRQRYCFCRIWHIPLHIQRFCQHRY